jgi:molecular chaperone DnaJ
MKDYYKILGVEETTTQDEIKKVYRKLSKQFHPDVNPDGEEKFKEIVEAYNHIGDENKRNEYDAKRKNPFMGMGGSPFDIHSMFEQMVGQNRQQKQRSPDKVISLDINCIESYFGVKKEMIILTNNRCKPCDGSGGSKKVCDTCNGNGFVIQVIGTGMFSHQIQQKCPVCLGSGTLITKACVSCYGKGLTQENEKINVNIPANVDNGDFLRLQSKGDFNIITRNRGDLILKVNLINVNNLEKIGIDLVYHKKITPIELVLDDSMLIKHPDGDINIKIPKELNSDKPLRVMNKGYKTPNGVGNFFIKLSVEKTSDLDGETKGRIKKLLEDVR